MPPGSSVTLESQVSATITDPVDVNVVIEYQVLQVLGDHAGNYSAGKYGDKSLNLVYNGPANTLQDKQDVVTIKVSWNYLSNLPI